MKKLCFDQNKESKQTCQTLDQVEDGDLLYLNRGHRRTQLQKGWNDIIVSAPLICLQALYSPLHLAPKIQISLSDRLKQ